MILETDIARFAGTEVWRWEFILRTAENDLRDMFPDAEFRGMVEFDLDVLSTCAISHDDGEA